MSEVNNRSIFLQTYVVWAAFSFVNIGLFFPILIPILLPFGLLFYVKFSAFITPVLILALGTSLIIFPKIYKRLNETDRAFSPAIYNIVLIVLIFIIADFYKFILIEKDI